MAQYLRLNKEQYGKSGLIHLKQLDDWILSGRVVDKFENQEVPVDLSGVTSLKAYMPGAESPVEVTVVANAGECGLVDIAVTGGLSESIALNSDGSSMYLIAVEGGQTRTIETYDAPIAVEARSFF